MSVERSDETGRMDVDVAVVGAGMGGIYAVHRFRSLGKTVQGFEGAPDVGGVWYHNNYPGARVDIEGEYYCFMFDEDLYAEWNWTERYPSQPEILAYLNHVADRFDIRRSFRFDTWVVGATWEPEHDRFVIETDTGDRITARYLIMASGQLSKPRDPGFPGLDSFAGERYQTSHWPHHEVELAGKRIGIIGTGSSGVQAVTAIAPIADHLYVFQRTPNYSAPANNGPTNPDRFRSLREQLPAAWREVLSAPAGNLAPPTAGKAGEYSPQQQQKLLEQRWAFGGQPLLTTFSDQGTNQEVNDMVGDFVRSQIRQKIKDPAVAELLMPNDYPIGTRRLCVDTGYYESFNRDNVTLVSIRDDPIERVTPTGITTVCAHYQLDVIILAIGFEAFTGALDAANVRNEFGTRPSEAWSRGPRTLLGLMTAGFPNLFVITGPGSPSVLANMNAGNVQHLDFVADLVARADAQGATRIEPTEDGVEFWTQRTADVARDLIRRQVDNYMVHKNADGTRVFIPWAGGFDTYVAACQSEARAGYPHFSFSGARRSGRVPENAS